MPFQSPWRSFEPGDLVYGVESNPYDGNRRKQIDAWTKTKPLTAQSAPATIDEYRILDVERTGVQSKDLKPWEVGLASSMQAHPKYGTAVGGDASSNAEVRKKDKGGLYWATYIEGKFVHFVLDGIDMRSVVGKTFGRFEEQAKTQEEKFAAGFLRTAYKKGHDSAPGAKTKTRSITNSELRWVFRNRAHANVQHYIQFWRKGAPCPPPWVEYKGEDVFLNAVDHTLWAQYTPSNTAIAPHQVAARKDIG